MKNDVVAQAKLYGLNAIDDTINIVDELEVSLQVDDTYTLVEIRDRVEEIVKQNERIKNLLKVSMEPLELEIEVISIYPVDGYDMDDYLDDKFTEQRELRKGIR